MKEITLKEIRDDYAQLLGYKNYIELLEDCSDLDIEFHTNNLMKIVKSKCESSYAPHAC